ncbi:hypothetical protein M9H77_05476 [Catharanthus roseus]|uniref:Uncharacterized protein n=1 Tax=Catharanthus roseus TaxID=4058 RepID=A0ACC0CH06_CATRO|nr:hypothetical protein M9H77_05476 [Catharanthus roseus]
MKLILQKPCLVASLDKNHRCPCTIDSQTLTTQLLTSSLPSTSSHEYIRFRRNRMRNKNPSLLHSSSSPSVTSQFQIQAKGEQQLDITTVKVKRSDLSYLETLQVSNLDSNRGRRTSSASSV